MEAVARLRNYPTSPMKMRLLVDSIRGKKIDWAIHYLSHHPQHGAVPLKKLVLSAVSNWKIKNNTSEVQNLYVKTIYVDAGSVLKRMLPAPQGRAHRKKKRSNHITVFVDNNENLKLVQNSSETFSEANVSHVVSSNKIKKTRSKKQNQTTAQ